MRVLLIVPSFSEIYGSYSKLYKQGFVNQPLSLCYLAGALEKAGHQPRIIDAEAENLSIEQINIEIAREMPDLIGLTATSVDFLKAKQLVAGIKSSFPRIPIVLGGTHINIFGKEVLRDIPGLDFGCIGDGEAFIVELAESFADDKGTRLENISGLIFRNGSEIVQNESRKLNTDLDSYPFPARHLLKNENYFRAVPYKGYQQTASLISSRGCPYKCVYCAVDKIPGGCTVRIRSAENVLQELELLIRKESVRHVAFNDDCLTIDKKRIYAICEGIHKRNLQFTWEGLSRADLVDLPLLKEMKKAGFVRMSYGIESGNKDILKVLNKGETLEQISEAFKISREVGIVTRGSVIIGAPYETRKTVKDTMRFIRRLKGLDQVVINVLQPYPGTRVRDMILNEEGGTKFIGSHDDHARLQRFGSSSVSVNDLSPKDLIFYQRLGFLRFYFRPLTFLKNLKFTGFRVLFKDGINFLRSIL